jgi:hypothetical protein
VIPSKPFLNTVFSLWSEHSIPSLRCKTCHLLIPNAVMNHR